MSGLRKPVLWVRRKLPRPRPERPRSSRIKVAQTSGGWWARQRCRLCPAWQLPMGRRGVRASTESLLEDRKEEMDKSLPVRRHLPILFKGKLTLKRQGTCPRPYSQLMAEPGRESKALNSKCSSPCNTQKMFAVFHF